MRPVYVLGAGGLSAFGPSRIGLGRALSSSRRAPVPVAGHHAVHALPPVSLPEPADAAERRARPQMARSAALAVMATRAAVADARLAPPLDEVGLFMGVGASTGDVGEVLAMLARSVTGEGLSLERLGGEGLRACSPLYAFQLMNSFTLSHSAILTGTGGPSAAFFSRGTGTITALAEAMHAIAGGECEQALAGGADSALHDVTLDELRRQGVLAQDLVPGEGAAMLALGASPERALARLDAAGVFGTPAALFAALETTDTWVVAPWGAARKEQLENAARRQGARCLDVTAATGECLAATPALGALAALELVSEAHRVAVVSAGLDGELGLLVFSRPS